MPDLLPSDPASTNPAPVSSTPAPAAPAPATPSEPIQGTPYNPPEPTPAPAPAPSPTPGTPAPGSPAPAVQSAAAAAAPAQPQSWSSAREYAQSLGLSGAANFQDDQSFLQNVFAMAQRAEQYQQQVQQLASQQAGLLNQLRQPQQGLQPGAAPTPTPAQPWWNPPDYNPAWEQLIDRDPQGNLTLRPGAPPDVLPKYLSYHQYRRDFADRLMRDPQATLAPMVEQIATQRAQSLLQEHLGAYQTKVFVDGWVNQNSTWLHQRDALGNLMTDPVSGRPMLSPAGERFRQHVGVAEQMGLKDARGQQEYAERMLRHDLLMQRYHQDQQAAAARQSVAGANRNPNLTGTVPLPGPPGSPAQPAQNPGLSLRDQLAQAMQTQGVTDQALMADLAR